MQIAKTMNTRRLLAGIEAGGTKFVCAVGPTPSEILRRVTLPTTLPAETLAAVNAFLVQAAVDLGAVAALGIASFGPVCVDRDQKAWGRILDTPKANWSGVDLVAGLAAGLDCPVAVDTDVNGAALAECLLGAGIGMGTVAYVTVGTGIGGGILVNGAPIHGQLHPEIGHLRPRRAANDSNFPGVCPFHGDCYEGLASGTAIAARFGAPLNALAKDHPAWAIEADYLAQLCVALVLTVSPQRIVLGGGVMNALPLFPLIRARLDHWLGGYPRPRAPTDLVVPPALGDNAGIAGALLLAQRLLAGT